MLYGDIMLGLAHRHSKLLCYSDYCIRIQELLVISSKSKRQGEGSTGLYDGCILVVCFEYCVEG